MLLFNSKLFKRFKYKRIILAYVWGYVIMKLMKLFSVLILIMFSVSFVSAARYIEYNFRDGELFFGNYTQGTMPLTDVNSIGYSCGDSDCDTISGILWNGNVLNSGGSDSLVVTYPTTLQSSYGYGIFFYKPGYVTWEQSGITHEGTKQGESTSVPTFSNTVYLTKANMCRAQIDTFSVTNDLKPNMPLIVNISASLNATTYAALSHAGPIDHIPSSLLDDYYSLETNVELIITDSEDTVVYIDDKDLLIEFSGEERVSFEWTPIEADSYTATVASYVVDEKCLDSEQMETSKDFTVLEEEPEGMCYTLLNNLNAVPLFAQEGTLITISAEKLSNMASGGELYPLPTSMQLWIYDDYGPIHTETKTVDANSDSSEFQRVEFTWTSTMTGMLQIVLNAAAIGCPFEENLDETEYMNYYIYKLPECNIDADCGTNEYVGEPVCGDDGDVYQDYRIYTCFNPATPDAYCSYTDIFRRVEECSYGCQNGECMDECYTDSDCPADYYSDGYCADDDVYADFHNFSCNQGSCEEEITSVVSEDCGEDEYGEWGYFCETDDVYRSRYYANHLCVNDGCVIATVVQTEHVEKCSYGCIDGECINESDIGCFIDSKCGTDGFLNTPYCAGDDVYDYYITYTCENAGTVDSFCSDDIESRVLEECFYGCIDGECISEDDIECFTDSDCGENTFFGGPFCKSDNVFMAYRFYICENPGTINSFCETGEEEAISERCDYGCEDAECKDKELIPLSGNLYLHDISLGTIDRFYVEDQLYFSITLINEGEVDFDDIGVSVLIYDLGLYYKFGSFDIGDGERVTKARVFDLPNDIKKGKYDVRIVVSNDDIRRVVHRGVTIV